MRAIRGMKDSMATINRREFGGAVLALGTGAGIVTGAGVLDETLRASVMRRKIPAAVAMAATAERTTYTGAFGKRDSAATADLAPDSIFHIASMTKAVTSVAAMQLVERGALKLDEPVSRHLPKLDGLRVLEGFDKNTGDPMLRPASKPVTLRRLLTHTAGFGYDTWDGNLLRYGGAAASGGVPPLLFEPGTRWEYGTNLDWTGRLVEAVSGETLETYFQRNILAPLGMRDTGFSVPAEKFDRLVSVYQRQSDGSLKENPRTPPAPPKTFNGGGGLYSTAGDYARFMQMILRRGRSSDGKQILRADTVDMMTSNQIGDLSAGKMKSVRPERSSDVDFHPGFSDKFGFGFLINTVAYEGGRSAGSLAWGGLENTFFWIDPRRGVCAVLLMQFLPFCDTEAMGLLHDFERAVYAALPA
jgi:CubicO group peptidase (beta-lactamase class C family)